MSSKAFAEASEIEQKGVSSSTMALILRFERELARRLKAGHIPTMKFGLSGI
jgi:hypothetical protein